MNRKFKAIVRTDVLVVGGAGAGSRAALEAAGRGAGVALVNKMQYGISGATAFKGAVIGQYQAVGTNPAEGDSFGRHAADILLAGAGMADEKLVKILVEEAPAQISALEKWGVTFEHENGNYQIIKGCFASAPRSYVLKDHGYRIVQALERAVRADGRIRIFEHTMITNLLIRDGCCVGALAVNRRNEWIVFEAGAVVAAAGGASRIFQYSMYPADITGDSYSIGFEAGAVMTNMEFVQLGLVTVHPGTGAVNTWTWRMNPRLRNSRGRCFLRDYLPQGMTEEEVMALKANHWPFTSSDASCAIEIAVQDQIMKGLHSPRGGIYVDFTHVGDQEYQSLPDSFKPIWTMMVNNFRERSIDLRYEPLEAVVGSHSVNGGYLIDETAATNVPGLFACGESSTGMHGADRLGGNNLPNSQVFGRRAGQYAARFAIGSMRRPVSREQADELIARWQSILAERHDGLSVPDMALRLKKLVSETLCTNRSEEGLNTLLKCIGEWKRELTGRGVLSQKGYISLCELYHMLQASELIATAARERKETRGSHHRKDYPHKEAGELSRIYLQHAQAGGIRVYRSPVMQQNGTAPKVQ